LGIFFVKYNKYIRQLINNLNNTQICTEVREMPAKIRRKTYIILPGMGFDKFVLCFPLSHIHKIGGWGRGGGVDKYL
jgi:hypothetical protein